MGKVEFQKSRFTSFLLGVAMGILLFAFQKLHIQPLSWLPKEFVQNVQQISLSYPPQASATTESAKLSAHE